MTTYTVGQLSSSSIITVPDIVISSEIDSKVTKDLSAMIMTNSTYEQQSSEGTLAEGCFYFIYDKETPELYV